MPLIVLLLLHTCACAGPCAQKLCSLHAQRAPHCPFCRALLSDLEVARELVVRRRAKLAAAALQQQQQQA